MNTIDLSRMSELNHINKKLISGYHISEQDLQLWQQLDHEFESYEALFNALGYQLIHDARGFYYLSMDESTPSMGKTSRAFALTLFILIEHFANSGKDPLRVIFEQPLDLEIMQQLVQLNKHLFDQLEIFSGSDLRKDVFMKMVRLGLAKQCEAGFLLQSPIYRYLDALLEINDYNALKDEQEVTS